MPNALSQMDLVFGPDINCTIEIAFVGHCLCFQNFNSLVLTLLIISPLCVIPNRKH